MAWSARCMAGEGWGAVGRGGARWGEVGEGSLRFVEGDRQTRTETLAVATAVPVFDATARSQASGWVGRVLRSVRRRGLGVPGLPGSGLAVSSAGAAMSGICTCTRVACIEDRTAIRTGRTK